MLTVFRHRYDQLCTSSWCAGLEPQGEAKSVERLIEVVMQTYFRDDISSLLMLLILRYGD